MKDQEARNRIYTESARVDQLQKRIDEQEKKNTVLRHEFDALFAYNFSNDYDFRYSLNFVAIRELVGRILEHLGLEVAAPNQSGWGIRKKLPVAKPTKRMDASEKG